MLDTLVFAPKLTTEVFDSVVASSAWMDAIRIDWSGTPEFPYVTRSALNNGISAIIPKQKMDPNPGNTITIGVSTQTVHYQPHDYYCGKEIQALRAKRLNLATAMVLVPALRAQVSKLAWGNGVSLKRLRRSQVMVPVNENGDVDWDGMERYGRWLLSQARRPLEVAPAASSS